jgi:hypothetical protein
VAADGLLLACTGLTVDESLLTGPRQPDGSLPKVAFLRPVDAKLAGTAGYTAYPGSKPAAK